MNNIVSPSILSCDFTNIEKEISYFENEQEVWIHLDVMDGHFVPNLTFGIPIIKQISKKTKLPLDAHLMVTNPEFHIEEMKDFGLSNITFHLEACENPLALLKKAKESYPSVGLSIKPKTSLDSLTDEILKELDLVLIMSVEPGFGGQSFIEGSLERISQLKDRREKLGTSFQIQVDGGISDQNAQIVREHGADNLVAGSYIFKKEPNEYLDLVNSLRKK